jgi:hypothetical protein
VATRAKPRKDRALRNPIDFLTHGLPRQWRIAIDWAITILGAIAIVLAIKAYVVNPYRIPSSSMASAGKTCSTERRTGQAVSLCLGFRF